MDHHDALTHLAILLASAFIGGAIFQKLKQPALVGYIVVGIILGPSVLGLVTERDNISFLAELGILLLLFLAAMELDLHNFKKVAKISIITCAVQIFSGLLFMGLIGYFLGWPLNRAILLGFAVSLSSTAVALKLLDELGLTKTRIGEKSLGILISQDIAVIPMILIIGALSTSEGFNYFGLVRLVIAIIVMIAVMYAFIKKPRILTKIGASFDKIHSKAMTGQTAVTGLALCFAGAALAGLAGVSAAYGAFLAGLVIGNTYNYKHLEEHTKPIFDVMIMVFFLSVGLLIDLEFVWEHISVILLLLFATMLIKTIINISVLRWQGMDKNEANVTGAVLGQVGEFSFILAAMGLSANTIQEEGYKYVVAIISLSLLATPIWLYGVKKLKILSYIQFKRRKENIKNSPL